MVSSSVGDKIPRPDGFNLSFFKSCWEIMQNDMVGFINNFYSNKRIPKTVTSSFIVLIPKVSNPQCLKEFKTIFLIGSLYHIV